MTALATAPDTHFLPSEDKDAFAAALDSFVRGVTIVTTDRGEGPIGVVADNFTGLSLDPPLVLWCLSRSSHRFAHFVDARRFAIHILEEHQQPVVDAFNGSKTAFAGLDWSTSSAGVPLLHGVAACFECNLETTHEAGDHAIVVGRVIRAHHGGGVPLALHGGKIGSFAARINQ